MIFEQKTPYQKLNDQMITKMLAWFLKKVKYYLGKIQINIYEIKRIYNFILFSIMLKQEQDPIEV